MQYHIAKNGEKFGPLEKEEVYRRLTTGELTGNDLGWCEGMAQWEPLSKLIAFGSSQPQGAGPLPGVKTSGMAIASMICGILGLLFWLPSLPAVILGHLGLSAIKKSDGALTGRGMAITGLVTGYLMIAALPLIAILAALAFPAFQSVQNQALQIKSMSDAKQLVLGMRQYAADHGGNFPPSLETLYEEEILDDRRLLELPLAQGKVSGEQAWEYRGADLNDSGDPSAIVLISRKTDRRGERIVARLDGSVEAVSGDKIEGP